MDRLGIAPAYVYARQYWAGRPGPAAAPTLVDFRRRRRPAWNFGTRRCSCVFRLVVTG